MKLGWMILLLPSLSIASISIKNIKPQTKSAEIAQQQKQQSVLQDNFAEILSMPLANAKSLVRDNQAEPLYKKLLSVAKSDSESMAARWKAVQLLSVFGDDRAVADLKKLGQSDTWFVKNSALLALNTVDPKKAHDMAYELLNDKALVVRSAAVEVLTQSSKLNRDILWQELNKQYNFRKGQSLWVRAQIVELLSKNPVDRELPQFAELLGDQEQRIQNAAVQSLEKIRKVTLGKSQDSIQKRRDLWVAWWKKNSQD